MRCSGTISPSKGRTLLAAGTALLAFASNAFAQQSQVLAVAFDTVDTAIPLSDGLTVAIALLLAATAFATLRRKEARGRRLLGWMLVLATGGVLYTATNPRIVSEASAALPSPEISLAVSPGTLDVSPYYSASPLVVIVTNTTGRIARITAIVLVPAAVLYDRDAGDQGTCQVGLIMQPGANCTVRLLALS